MHIYFAAPLFSQAERTFNERLAQQLEALGFQVFLPQRDGVENDKPPYDTMTKEERGQAIFHLDQQQVFACDIFLFILDGRIPDEGACVELGLAYAQSTIERRKKLLIGFQTTIRVQLFGATLNPMVSVPLDAIVYDEKTLLEALQQYRTAGTIAQEG